MPKSVAELPKYLKMYRFHGITTNYDPDEGQDEVFGECFVCGAERKLYVEVETGKFHCKVCGVSGNEYSFFRELHSVSMRSTRSYEWVEAHRGIPASVLQEWGVCLSVTTRDWIMPGYLANGNIGTLYRYVGVRGEDGETSYSLRCTAETSHGYFAAMARMDASKPTVYVCEGGWDGPALHSAIGSAGEGGLLIGGNAVTLDQVNIIGVPGCNVFRESWTKMFTGKHTVFLFDNDYPRERNGKVSQPGFDGLQAAVSVLASVDDDHKAASLAYLDWSGGEGKGYSETFPDGYDIRDASRDGQGVLEDVLSGIRPVPAEWVEGKKPKRNQKITPTTCKSWRVLVNSWRKAMKWTDGLEGALAVMLASVASVKFSGEQLWLKIVSPPSGGKTTLCEGLGTAVRYVTSESCMNGFYSGYKLGKDDDKDYSLAGRLFDKTLITKDGDTILSCPYKDQIMGEARDLYDGAARKSYNNNIRREYSGLRFTWIIAGTRSLRKIDQSELGQRFIDYVIMEEIDDDLEDEIINQSAFAQARIGKTESNCKAETTIDPRLVEAWKLTGGYVEYLKQNADAIISGIEQPEDVLRWCGRLAKFTSYMRARPSSSQEESEGRELAGRLTKQFVKLAQFVAVVYGAKSIGDKRVRKLVNKVALDTSRGRTLEIVMTLAQAGTRGMVSKQIAGYTRQDTAREGVYLKFLHRIKAVEQVGTDNGVSRWRLSDEFRKLYSIAAGAK